MIKRTALCHMLLAERHKKFRKEEGMGSRGRGEGEKGSL